MRLGALILVLMLGAGAAAQGTLTGKFVLPGTGPVANGTLLLALSQAATSSGGNVLVPAQASCSTSTDGSVVGVPNPSATPTGTAFTTSGTLAAGSYDVAIAYVGASSTTTLASPAALFALAAPGELVINAPVLQPAAATGYAVYLGTTLGSMTLQGTVTGWGSYTQAVPQTPGAALPASNDTACTLLFNDAILPTGTWYTATLEDANGNVLAGFPRNWYLTGLSENVGSLAALGENPAVQFPLPLLQNPANPNLAQSVNSGLNLNGYLLTGSGNVGPGFFGLFWPGAAPAAGTVLGQWTPNVAIGIVRMDVNAQTAGAGGTNGMTITVGNGTTTCTFAGLLPAAAVASSQTASGAPGSCVFPAGVALAITLSGDDHSTKPQNLNVGLETIAH